MSIRLVLLARGVVGINVGGTVKATIARGGPVNEACLTDLSVEFKVFAFANLAFSLHDDAGGLVEVDDYLVTQSLSFGIGGSEGERDGLVFKVLVTGRVDGCEDVVMIETAVSRSGPKQVLIAYCVGSHLDGFLATLLVGTGVAGKGDVTQREEDVIDPNTVLSAAAVAVFLIGPGEYMLALGDGDGHLTPVETSAPLLHEFAVDIELEVVALLAVGLSVEQDFVGGVLHIE